MATVEQARPAELPPDALESDAEALFREAKRRELRRRLAWLAALIALAGLAIAAFAVTRADSASGGASPAAGSNAAPGALAGPGLALLPASGTLILLVDTSGSMGANDIKSTRLEAAQNALIALVQNLPQATRVGLVTFNTDATVEVAPTFDHGTVVGALDELNAGGGSAIGDGIEAAVRLATASLAEQGIQSAPGQQLPAAIVLETDGGQNRGTLSPADAAKLAKAAGIRVDGISVGSPTGAITFGYGSQTLNVHLPPDRATVRSISSVTGGESFDGTDAASLDAISREIASSIG